MNYLRIQLYLAVGLGLASLLAGCRSPLVQSGPKPPVSIAQRAEAYAHYSAGIVQDLNGNAPAAWQEFYLAAQADDSDLELLVDVSNRLIEGRQFEKARDVLNWATELPGAGGEVYMRLGYVYAQLGRTDQAIAASKLAVQRLPGFLPARNNLYLNYLQARQPQQAQEVLDDAGRQPGIDADYQLNLAELYANLSQHFPALRQDAAAKAVALLDQAQAKDSLRGMARLRLADAYYVFGETQKAARIYLDFLAHGEPPSPLRDLLRAKLTEIYLRGNDHARAREQLTAITTENPSNAGAYYFLGALDLDSQRWDEAINCFTRALAISPDFDAARFDLAAAQIASGRWEAALTSLRDWQKQKPATFLREYLTGLAYYGQEKYSEARTHLISAEQLAQTSETNRLDTEFYFQLGAASERVGKISDAVNCFEKSIALAPQNAAALNYLGYMWAERGENLERARALIQSALELQPENDAFLDSMGWVLFKLGDLHESLNFLEKAVARSETPDATLYDHLGDVHAALKEMDQARAAWEKSLSIETSAAVQQKLQAAKKY